MTATYWEIGRRIVEFEQGGERRAGYGEELLKRLFQDLTLKLGHGFARPKLIRFRQFCQTFPTAGIRSTASNVSSTPAHISSTVSNELSATSFFRDIVQEIADVVCTTEPRRTRPSVLAAVC